MTRVTLRTHDLPMFFGGANARIRATSDESFARLIDRFIAFYATALFNPHWGEGVTIRPDNRLDIAMVHQGLDGDAAKAIWQPFFAWVAARPADYAYDDPPSVGAGPARGWWDAQARRASGSTAVVFDDRPDAEPTHAWWSGDQEQVSAFLHGYESLWLPESLLRGGPRASLASALVAASHHTAVQLHFNKGLAGAPPDVIRAARDTAMHPDVTTAFALAIMATGGAPPFAELGLTLDRAQAQKNASAVTQAATALRRVAPRAGSYVSESNFFNPRWQSALWGGHHARLQQIKRTYDAGGLFYVHHGIGSEAWQEGGFVPK